MTDVELGTCRASPAFVCLAFGFVLDLWGAGVALLPLRAADRAIPTHDPCPAFVLWLPRSLHARCLCAPIWLNLLLPCLPMRCVLQEMLRRGLQTARRMRLVAGAAALVVGASAFAMNNRTVRLQGTGATPAPLTGLSTCPEFI